jgi:uroporphyrinogen-III decarboxylase
VACAVAGTAGVHSTLTEDVRRAVEENLRETGGIGHVLGSSNSVVYETPAENYVAMVESAREWRVESRE